MMLGIFEVIAEMQERETWPWAFFGEDGKVYDQPPEGIYFRARRVPSQKLEELLKN